MKYHYFLTLSNEFYDFLMKLNFLKWFFDEILWFLMIFRWSFIFFMIFMIFHQHIYIYATSEADTQSSGQRRKSRTKCFYPALFPAYQPDALPADYNFSIFFDEISWFIMIIRWNLMIYNAFSWFFDEIWLFFMIWWSVRKFSALIYLHERTRTIAEPNENFSFGSF